MTLPSATISPVLLLTLIVSAVIWESACLTRTLPVAVTQPPSWTVKLSAEMSIGESVFMGLARLGMAASAAKATTSAKAAAMSARRDRIIVFLRIGGFILRTPFRRICFIIHEGWHPCLPCLGLKCRGVSAIIFSSAVRAEGVAPARRKVAPGRKVRTPQGRASGRQGRNGVAIPAPMESATETNRLGRKAAARVKRRCKRPPAVQRWAVPGKPRPEQGRIGGLRRCPRRRSDAYAPGLTALDK